MNGTIDQGEARISGGAAAADSLALRGLFERVRAHVEAAETRAQTGGQGRASDREAARDLERVAAELARMADDLARRLARADDDRITALRALAGDVADRAGRLDALAAGGAARLQDRLDGVVQRLGRWEAAAGGADQRLAKALDQRLGAEETRRRGAIAGLRAVPRRPEPAGSQAPPEGARRDSSLPSSRRGSRSAAFLMSAGVACLGLATLAVVLEPPFPAREPAADAGAPLVLRGPILVEPPRYAYAPELSPPPAADGPEQPGAAKPKDLAAVMRDFEAGRPGALTALRTLAMGGDPRAQMYLARQYEEGRGVAVDVVQARRWTARAAEAGDPVGMHNLALYYLQGRGGPRDDVAAARLLRRAAAEGVPDSQFNLGLLYETGAGVERNLVEAYKWFQIAANSGDLKARARAIALEARLSRKEQTLAERDVDRFARGRPPEETVLIPGADTVAESQRKLARMGLYIGPTDGQDTPDYRQAVEAYRRGENVEAETVALVTSGS